MDEISVDKLAVWLNITPALAKSLHPVLKQPVTREVLEQFAKDFALKLHMPKEKCDACSAKFEKEYILCDGVYYCLPCGHGVIIERGSFSVNQV